MNFMSLNIKGVAFDRKKRWIKELKAEHNIHFVCLQETFASDSSSLALNACWGNNNFDFEWVDALGRSGGILSIWDASRFSKSEVIKDRNFLLVKGYVTGEASPFYVVNVYGPQDPLDKRDLWNKLLALKNSMRGLWIFLGDFNEVRVLEDRFNSNFNHLCAQRFNEFISEADLAEYAMGGKKFTFRAGNSQKLSKIDRMLVCSNFWNKWPEADLAALPMLHSDHSPIVLITDPFDFGPKPFKFFDSWFENPELERMVRKGIEEFRGGGAPDSMLAGKFRAIKNVLKEWSKELARQNGEAYELAKEKVILFELAAEERELLDCEIAENWAARTLLQDLDARKAQDARQQSRIKWAISGDENSRYFHRLLEVELAVLVFRV